MWKYSDERVTWKVASNVAQKKVRSAPVDSLMPLYRRDDEIYLSFVIDGRMFPLYRYMHGDLSTFVRYYNMTVQHVIQFAESTMKTCEMLLRSGFHHCDIKPYNVLFRVTDADDFDRAPAEQNSVDQTAYHRDLAKRTKGRVEFVLADYGTAVWEPKTMREVWTMPGTAGFLSPLAHKEYHDFEHEFNDRIRRACVPSTLTADAVWDSYAHVMPSPTQAMVKNDIYALGVTMLYFKTPLEIQNLAIDLVMGTGPWTFDAVLRALNELKKTYRKRKELELSIHRCM